MNKKIALFCMLTATLGPAANVAIAQDDDLLMATVDLDANQEADASAEVDSDLLDLPEPDAMVPGAAGLLEPVTDYLGDTLENAGTQLNDTVDLVEDLVGGLGGLGGEGGLLGGLLGGAL